MSGTGPQASLLREIADRLERLAGQGEEEAIDLRALPVMGPEEIAGLREMLGTGEVTARVEAMGPTEVRETAYAGVWWITYYGADGAVLAEHIEIAHMPDILRARDADIEESRESLLDRLAEAPPAGDGKGESPEATAMAPDVRWQRD